MYQSNQDPINLHRPKNPTTYSIKITSVEIAMKIPYSYLYQRFKSILMPMMENKQHQSSNQKRPKKPNDPTRQPPPHWAPEFSLPPPHFCLFLPQSTNKSETQKNPNLKQDREIKYKRFSRHHSSLALYISRILCFRGNEKLLCIENCSKRIKKRDPR